MLQRIGAATAEEKETFGQPVAGGVIKVGEKDQIRDRLPNEETARSTIVSSLSPHPSPLPRGEGVRCGAYLIQNAFAFNSAFDKDCSIDGSRLTHYKAPCLLPLLGGEGWGEGKGSVPALRRIRSVVILD